MCIILYDCSTKGFSICSTPFTGHTVITEVPRATNNPMFLCSPFRRYGSFGSNCLITPTFVSRFPFTWSFQVGKKWQCTLPLSCSTAWSRTRFKRESHPFSMPCTWRPPVSRTITCWSASRDKSIITFGGAPFLVVFLSFCDCLFTMVNTGLIGFVFWLVISIARYAKQIAYHVGWKKVSLFVSCLIRMRSHSPARELHRSVRSNFQLFKCLLHIHDTCRLS